VESAIKMCEGFASKGQIKGCDTQLFYDPVEEGEQYHFHSPRGRGRGRGNFQPREDRRPEPAPENVVKIEDLANFLKPAHKGKDIY
jgi:hypothetical protein